MPDANHRYAEQLTCQLDWEVARWAKMRGPGSTAVSELFGINSLARRLGLSYTNSRELNRIIDKKIPHTRPQFRCEEIVVAGEAFDVYIRDIIECIKSLFGDSEFTPHLLLRPKRHFTDSKKQENAYLDMNTGTWWWKTQQEIESMKPGATIIPVIISSDKTQLMLFRNKCAYPVYMTIGNLPKDIRRKPSRRGHILLAYLPVTRLEHVTNQAARQRMLSNLFHACMGRVLEPLKTAGVDGVLMSSGDGVVRRAHPILVVFIGDYPEQVLVCCCKTSDCPKCIVERNEIGESEDPSPLCDLVSILSALGELDNGPLAFARACQEAGIKPVIWPFWQDLPYVNIYLSITPDILYQLYQGVMKHLIAWIKAIYGSAELDARCRRLPPNHGVRLFINGISKLYRVSGKEHADICRILLGLIVGIPLQNGFLAQRLTRAVRALLDFLYLAQYPMHTSSTLTLLQNALKQFHDNKAIFVELGVRSHFKLPKLHSLNHYEKVQRHQAYIACVLARRPSPESATFADGTVRQRVSMGAPTPAPESHFHIAKTPSVKAVSFSSLRQSARIYFRFSSVQVFHKIKFAIKDLSSQESVDSSSLDIAHVKPPSKDKRGKTVPGRFDMVLIRSVESSTLIGAHNYQVAQLRVVFKIREKDMAALFLLTVKRPNYLAYVEWFTPFRYMDPNMQLYQISRSVWQGRRLASVIDVEKISRSCHLFPNFGLVVPREWKSSHVLDSVPSFFVNPFVDRNSYMTLA
ncbi:hypothetical protein V8E55_011417 [Tylopilus felleus]